MHRRRAGCHSSPVQPTFYTWGKMLTSISKELYWVCLLGSDRPSEAVRMFRNGLFKFSIHLGERFWTLLDKMNRIHMVFMKYTWLLFPIAADGTQNKKWPGTSLPTASSLHKTAQESRKIFDSFSFEEGFSYFWALKKKFIGRDSSQIFTMTLGRRENQKKYPALWCRVPNICHCFGLKRYIPQGGSYSRGAVDGPLVSNLPWSSWWDCCPRLQR